MLYHIFHSLRNVTDIPGAGLFEFITFRAMMAGMTALLFGIFGGKAIIRKLQKLQIGEEVRDLGLQGQLEKKGTPTMGGIIIILGILLGVLLFCDLTNIYVQLLILTTVVLGGLGFADDYIKVFKHDKGGMSEKTKLIGQTLLGVSIALAVCFSDQIVVRAPAGESGAAKISNDEVEVVEEGGKTISLNEFKSTKTTIPFVKSHEFDYGSLVPFGGRFGRLCRWALYVLMIVFVIVACSNGTNFSDGIDGLCAGNSAITGAVIGIFAWISGNFQDSGYLNIMYIPGTGEIAIFMAAFLGALISFLWYNSFPAQVFMGDTGSLAIGGIIGVATVLIRKELLLPIIGGIIFAEALSVLLQRTYFKYTKKKYGQGRRIFKMAPIHHHFQKEGIGDSLLRKPVGGMHENKVTTRFWIVGIILGIIAIGLLKIR